MRRFSVVPARTRHDSRDEQRSDKDGDHGEAARVAHEVARREHGREPDELTGHVRGKEPDQHEKSDGVNVAGRRAKYRHGTAVVAALADQAVRIRNQRRVGCDTAQVRNELEVALRGRSPNPTS